MKVAKILPFEGEVKEYLNSTSGPICTTDILEDNTTQETRSRVSQTIQVQLGSICPNIESIEFLLAPNRLPIRNQIVGLDFYYTNNDKSNEIAVIKFYYREENEPGFFGLILLQSHELAIELMAKAKPDNTEFIARTNIAASTKDNQFFKDARTMNKNLFHSEAGERFCKTLHDKSNNGSMTQETIRDIICDFHGKQMKTLMLNDYIASLCKSGVIDAIKQDDHFIFALREICYIKADSYRFKEDQIALKSLKAKRNAAERKIEEAQKEIEIQSKKISALDQELNIILTKYPSVDLETCE